ncbi:unnamed protein product [Prorocentrum cordatum]|uniref:Uncharacterized protein n=1 Tax=Prorocentrum cordatum TaxID=2364126 RepID=A0ABN9U3G4_9DINO|nr:unnamed protein product [Polarella glacialis]
MAMPGPMLGPGGPPVQRVQPQAFGGGGGYAPLPAAGGAVHPGPPHLEPYGGAGLHEFERIFFEPEGEQKHTKWVYVGQGQGQYAQQDYRYVGEGAGDYHKEEVVIPHGRKLRQECLWCVAALCCAIFSTILLIASSRAFSSGGPAEKPAVLLPPQLQVTCRELLLWPDRDQAAAEVVCGNCQALVVKTNFHSCSAYCHSFGQQCFYAAQDKVDASGHHSDGCQVESELECDGFQPGDGDMICGCKDPDAALAAAGADDEVVGDRPMTDEERDELCSEDGADCSEAMCCKTAGLKCFRKDEYWSECLEACEQGVHVSDEPQYRTPWKCEDIDRSGQEGSALWNRWHNAANAVGSAAGATFDAAMTHGSNAVDATVDAVDSAGQRIHEAKNAASSVFDITASDISDSIGHQVKKAKNAAKNASGEMLNSAGHLVNKAKDATVHHAEKAKDASGDMLISAGHLVKGNNDAATSAAEDASHEANDDNQSSAAADSGKQIGGQAAEAVEGANDSVAGEPGSATTDPAEAQDTGCSRLGENCKGIGCCADQNFTCFEHGSYWAECLPECQPGVHESDAPQFRSPWTCAVLTRASPGVLPPGYVLTTSPPLADQPAEDSEFDCRVKTSSTVSQWSPEQKNWCCENANVGCPLFNCTEGEPAAWSADQKAFCCETAQKGCEGDSLPAGAQGGLDQPAADNESGMAPSTPPPTFDVEVCSETPDEDCSTTKCCKDPGRFCYGKNGGAAGCLTTCVEGMTGADEDQPWSCTLVEEFNCRHDDYTLDSYEKKLDYCCTLHGMGCNAPPHASPPPLANGIANGSTNGSANTTVDAPPAPPPLADSPPPLADGSASGSSNGSANGSANATVNAPLVPPAAPSAPPPLDEGSANGSATIDAPVPPAAGGSDPSALPPPLADGSASGSSNGSANGSATVDAATVPPAAPPPLDEGSASGSATEDAPVPPAAGGSDPSALPPPPPLADGSASGSSNGSANSSATGDAPLVPPAAGGAPLAMQPPQLVANSSASESGVAEGGARPLTPPPPLATDSANSSATADAPPMPLAGSPGSGAPSSTTGGSATSTAAGSTESVTGGAVLQPAETPSAVPSDVTDGKRRLGQLRGAAAGASASEDHSAM